MKWTPGTDNDDVVDQRGRRTGAGKLAGGSIGTVIVVVIVARLFGVDISGLLGSTDHSAPAPRSDRAQPPAGADPDAKLVDFIRFVMKDIQDTFTAKLRDARPSYRRAKLVLFTDAIDTGCGRSSSAIGPFYCPADEHAYIDLSFYRELKRRFGAPGDFAQAYVLAHEIGHHLQKIFAAEQHARDDNETSVRIELQADCYAGVWGHDAQRRDLLEAGDIEEAITAAQAIGDDRLQKQAGRRVNPETFTHGTSDQRVRWFRRGFDAGKLEACDTFAARDARSL